MISSLSSATPPSSISRSDFAISDSGMPNMRSITPPYGSAFSSTAATGSVAIAASHIACSSRGGPGMTITTGPDSAGTTRPGAVPAGSIVVEPFGITACLRLAARTASRSKPARRAKAARIRAIFSSISSSSTISRPAKRPTTSAVRSSAVGPRPPLVTIRSIPSSERKRRAPSTSSGRSATIVMWETSTPRLARLCEIQGPLRSVIVPVITSVPVTTMPARTLTRPS